MPRQNRNDRARFEKLKEAYVKARYSRYYRITGDELLWLGSCVEELSGVVHTICLDRIVQLTDQAK